MMPVVEALAHAAEHGVTFWLRNGRVRCGNGEALPPHLFEPLYAQLDELRAVLTGELCRYCAAQINWRRLDNVAFADGSGACLGCYERVETERQAAQAKRQPKEQAA